ncbi:MAG: bifunctional pyr operon transcriptional regulator/uracil phosphoribosyltransferase PyrR [Granulosicoccus sp.]
MTPLTKYGSETVSTWLDAMQKPLAAVLRKEPDAALIGIRRGGVEVGRYLHQRLTPTEPLGELNIAFYRDDFSSIGLHPVVGPSQVPFTVDDRHIILIDDVLGTGRTVRAAMNEIFDYGRPAKITLAVLVQRSGHELPIRADVIGHTVELSSEQYIELNASDMSVSINERRA